MKFSTILAGAFLAVSTQAAAFGPGDDILQRVTVYNTHTVTKIQASTVYQTETVTKGKTIYTTVYATVTKYRTKTKKFCPATASPTMSVYGRDLTGKKARAAGEQPLYAQEFA